MDGSLRYAQGTHVAKKPCHVQGRFQVKKSMSRCPSEIVQMGGTSIAFAEEPRFHLLVLSNQFVSSVRSSSGYHGLLHTYNPVFQIFQILQILK